jgi:hypothetical protein
MTKKQKQIEILAQSMSEMYWRGRLEVLQLDPKNDNVKFAIRDAAAKEDIKSFHLNAEIILEMIENTTSEDNTLENN